jgi:hypothetical protein
MCIAFYKNVYACIYQFENICMDLYIYINVYLYVEKSGNGYYGRYINVYLCIYVCVNTFIYKCLLIIMYMMNNLEIWI